MNDQLKSLTGFPRQKNATKVIQRYTVIPSKCIHLQFKNRGKNGNQNI
jgi:hypothetical protein